MKSERSEQLGKNYWRLWSAHATSNLGDGLASVAFPWLASAVTREPFLIALIAVMSRLPWLVFTLPAGVITDRYDRKKIIVSMNLSQGFLALFLAILVFFNRNSFPNLDSLSESASFQTNFPPICCALCQPPFEFWPLAWRWLLPPTHRLGSVF